MGNVFTFYIWIIGILTLLAFGGERPLNEVLNLITIYQLYIVLFVVYIIFNGLKFIPLQQLQVAEILEWTVNSLVGIIVLSFVADKPYGIIFILIAGFAIKVFMILFVKIKKYSTECIGYVIKTHKVDDGNHG